LLFEEVGIYLKTCFRAIQNSFHFRAVFELITMESVMPKGLPKRRTECIAVPSQFAFQEGEQYVQVGVQIESGGWSFEIGSKPFYNHTFPG
jgi:hypothetical protein